MSAQKNRVYIASKVGLMDEAVRQLRRELERRGYVIIYDWTEVIVEKPFADHPEQVREASMAMAKAVMNCDIMIVLTAPGGIGYHIETGGALVASMILHFITGQEPQVEKRLFVVGADNERSVFYFDPLVTRLPDILALLRHLPPIDVVA